MSKATTELTNKQTFDAQQIAEDVASGEKKIPQVDVSADYEASKEFSVSEVDRTGAGTQAAATATAAKFDISAPKDTKLKTQSSGNQDEFISMVKEINPEPEEVGAVSDELLQKALDKGTPG
ncbi:hypothetical protein [Kamptonema sp. UHCC 0994]|uniref:hypothetical protein n=1 Tax=Kamptonema sp. UHCC 0994 TaxID=3031329 RepID=UPI0023BAB523|nr:hypothetical protein [Kamptonema sp. UHCC 0994]MDF0556769.1 hypothetical protein [Kamptonema sp. UHCC 0994]